MGAGIAQVSAAGRRRHGGRGAAVPRSERRAAERAPPVRAWQRRVPGPPAALWVPRRVRVRVMLLLVAPELLPEPERPPRPSAVRGQRGGGRCCRRSASREAGRTEFGVLRC